ncbi:aminotransferase class III-fold pyridoxal phosphate-dependent enzyme [Spartinivicinus poritis]|uniref:Aminotransferase class III-fold pyridoxal phosphate-dependent enzyme n=1 Tax=Spartinivicinus poritis TaxID=2994640 RepID=A0ABT5U8Q6_9GAMM|nr:aminotransferase class III-fold pyridoxal phosphate-dependent enzyme [Spartinivicinus sp. A2-2]MDE1461504.1 aminotransferase class III-fold pyridoxal phosphate-dependent enzyme [Spartinivicinus sp. A2-2]
MKFGFIAHPTSIGLKRYVKMLDMFDRTTKDLHSGYDRQLWSHRNLIPFVDFGQIQSATGSVCEGIVHYLPMTAEEMLQSARTVQQRIFDGIASMELMGSQLVGLGGFTSIIGKRGLETAKQAKLPVTSGNSLTTYSGYKVIVQLIDWLKLKPDNTRIAIVGYPGSICLSLTKLLLKLGCHLDLVHRTRNASKSEILEDIPEKWHDKITVTDKIDDCYQRNLIYATATSSGGVINANKLMPGAIVVDIALPRDVTQLVTPRNDILIIDGGCVTASNQVKFGGESLNLGIKQQLNGCLAETMVLALENRAECFSIGRDLAPEKVIEIGKLAEQHGFFTLPLASYGHRISKEAIEHFRHYHFNRVIDKTHTSPVNTELSSQQHLPVDTRSQTIHRFRSHINPMMADFLQMQHCDRVFERAEKSTLTDTNGTQYLDMVAGYGCLNLGHNPTAVVEAAQQFLQSDTPNFIQYISIPKQTSQLAERLCQITPGKMERVFFSNSGAEAVEAAIKLAKAASNRPQLVYADNSYHGKTLGALSITGREKHCKHFRPLLPGCVSVPFGDIDALRAVLEKRDTAAFIIEPIQGEGGVYVPPSGYLKAAETLCRQTNTLFIVDEIQTGMGRTGKLFACEWENINPDILILSKSLSGGLVPIGATLSTAKIWDAAYGTSGRFLVHTSTFGGGNLAATTGLAAINSIIEQKLFEKADKQGLYLKQGLEKIASKYPFISAIRGQGLMLGIQFKQNFQGAVEACANELATRFPGDWFRTYQFLPDELKGHMSGVIKEMEKSLAEMFCMRFVTKLGNDHHILTFITANSSTVMRIQPPLIITKEEIDHFVKSFGIVCEEMSTFMD